MFFRNRKFAAMAGGCLLAFATNSYAQAESSSVQSALRGIAAASLQTPVAYGARWRTAGASFYAQSVETAEGNNDADGSAAIVLGLGDPDSVVGIDVAVGSSALSQSEGGKSGFGDSGSFAAKVHRNLPGYMAVAVGVSGFGRWGDLKHNSKESVYGVVTRFFGLGGAWGLIANLGAGTEGYNDPGEDGVGVLGSLALYYTPRYSLLIEHTGRFTNAGISIAPLRSLPATVTVGVINIGQRLDLDAEAGANISIGYAY
jgi:hypothetical protein